MSDRSNYYILDERNAAVSVEDVLEWAGWFEKHDRRVARTEISGLMVSTVFLGSDHQFGDGPPLLFETLTFGGDEEICERCSTWAEAEAQHERVCQAVRDKARAGL